MLDMMHVPIRTRATDHARTTWRRCGGLAALLFGIPVLPLVSQQPAVLARPTPFSIDVDLFHHRLDNGYSPWSGGGLRLAYAGTRASPFATVTRQHRREGSQDNYGLGSYLILNRAMYAIAGFSVATGGTAVLYPRLRWDVSLMTDTRVVPGLVIATGFTRVSFGADATGTIASLGPIYYRGPLILSGVVRLNRDDVGGATTASGEFGGQYGAEGRSWIGASISGGREAYQVVSATPFDVAFTNVGASAFYQRWLTERTAITGRVEYQHKLEAYRRRGLALSYRVAF